MAKRFLANYVAPKIETEWLTLQSQVKEGLKLVGVEMHRVISDLSSEGKDLTCGQIGILLR
jgi:hypothetical protein